MRNCLFHMKRWDFILAQVAIKRNIVYHEFMLYSVAADIQQPHTIWRTIKTCWTKINVLFQSTNEIQERRRYTKIHDFFLLWMTTTISFIQIHVQVYSNFIPLFSLSSSLFYSKIDIFVKSQKSKRKNVKMNLLVRCLRKMRCTYRKDPLTCQWSAVTLFLGALNHSEPAFLCL